MLERQQTKEKLLENVFSITLYEYQAINEKSRCIDSRASVFLTFLITAFPIYLNIIGLNNLKQLFVFLNISLLKGFQIGIFCSSIITFILSLVFLISTLAVRRYTTFDVEYFNSLDLNLMRDKEYDSDHVNLLLTKCLTEIIDDNSKIYGNKVRKFTTSLIFSFIYVLLMISSIIIMIF